MSLSSFTLRNVLLWSFLSSSFEELASSTQLNTQTEPLKGSSVTCRDLLPSMRTITERNLFPVKDSMPVLPSISVTRDSGLVCSTSSTLFPSSFRCTSDPPGTQTDQAKLCPPSTSSPSSVTATFKPRRTLLRKQWPSLPDGFSSKSLLSSGNPVWVTLDPAMCRYFPVATLFSLTAPPPCGLSSTTQRMFAYLGKAVVVTSPLGSDHK
mmetsp:Transcript_78505/g.244535  ORF Transcript_78505/g.244535 Transcript_78505/m.244535 type:complete len:209 (-) Transcript_78505:1500-2126(-)